MTALMLMIVQALQRELAHVDVQDSTLANHLDENEDEGTSVLREIRGPQWQEVPYKNNGGRAPTEPALTTPLEALVEV